jgi:hypothetical protein
MHGQQQSARERRAKREADALQAIINVGEAEIENAFTATPRLKWWWLYEARNSLRDELSALAEQFLQVSDDDRGLSDIGFALKIEDRMRLATQRMRAHAGGVMSKARAAMPPPRRRP